MLLCQVLKKEGGGEGHNLMRRNVMFNAVAVLAMINISQQNQKNVSYFKNFNCLLFAECHLLDSLRLFLASPEEI